MYNQPDNFDRNGPIEIVSGERYLLNSFLAKLIRLDPDLIASHELNSAVLEILYNRMTVN